MRFQKCPFSSRRKRSKIVYSTRVFVSFSPIHTKTLEHDENDWFLGLRMCCMTRPSAILDRYSDLDWNRWHVPLFTSPFSKVSVTRNEAFFTTMRFQKSTLLKPFSKVSVFVGVFGRFSVDVRRKRIKKYVFSNA